MDEDADDFIKNKPSIITSWNELEDKPFYTQPGGLFTHSTNRDDRDNWIYAINSRYRYYWKKFSDNIPPKEGFIGSTFK
jgi:hypothetical protein